MTWPCMASGLRQNATEHAVNALIVDAIRRALIERLDQVNEIRAARAACLDGLRKMCACRDVEGRVNGRRAAHMNGGGDQLRAVRLVQRCADSSGLTCDVLVSVKDQRGRLGRRGAVGHQRRKSGRKRRRQRRREGRRE
eukprot:5197675-Prymnesium_polylepis.2